MLVRVCGQASWCMYEGLCRLVSHSQFSFWSVFKIVSLGGSLGNRLITGLGENFGKFT